jgi:hypothetical protein
MTGEIPDLPPELLPDDEFPDDVCSGMCDGCPVGSEQARVLVARVMKTNGWTHIFNASFDERAEKIRQANDGTMPVGLSSIDTALVRITNGECSTTTGIIDK